jgi:arylsulfatase A-like enzyme
MLQDKGLYSKELPFESSARVPFIVRYPEKFRPGTSNENFTDLMDILPTILELSGIDYNYKEKHLAYRLEGHSLVSGKKRKYAYSEFGTGKIRWAMVRDEKFKYAYFYNGGREFFYDLDKDPKELNNLAKSPRAPMADLQRLRKKCVEMEKIRAPEGHVAGDHLKAFSAEKISKFSASKYPLWSNQQFQKFGTEKAPRETSLFIEEINGALGMTEKEYMDSMPNDAEYREEFAKNFRNIKS